MHHTQKAAPAQTEAAEFTEFFRGQSDFFFAMLFDHACSGHKFHLVEIQFLNSIAGMYVIDDSLQAGVVLELLIIEAVCKIFFHIY